jgi:hypothetical protein
MIKSPYACACDKIKIFHRMDLGKSMILKLEHKEKMSLQWHVCILKYVPMRSFQPSGM